MIKKHRCVEFFRKFPENMEYSSTILDIKEIVANIFINKSSEYCDIVALNNWVTTDSVSDTDQLAQSQKEISMAITDSISAFIYATKERYCQKKFNNFVSTVKEDFDTSRGIPLQDPSEEYLSRLKKYLPLTYNYLSYTQLCFHANDINFPKDLDIKDFLNSVIVEYSFFRYILNLRLSDLLYNDLEDNYTEALKVIFTLLGSSLFKQLTRFFEFTYPFPDESSIQIRMPKNIRKMYNKNLYNNLGIEFLKILNKVDESDLISFYEDNFFSLLGGIDEKSERSLSTANFWNAVRFYTLVSGGHTYLSAYSIVFLDRVERTKKDIEKSNPELSEDEVDKILKDRIASKASLYAKGKLVSTVLAKDILPNSIKYHDIRHKAFNTLMEVCNNPRERAKTRIEASNYILTHTNNLIKDDGIAELTNSISSISPLAEQLKKLTTAQDFLLNSGKMSLEEISKQPIYYDDDTD